MCVEQCHQMFQSSQYGSFGSNEIHYRCYEFTDAFSMLTLMFIKQSGNPGNIDQKFQFLIKILTILVGSATSKQESQQLNFISFPFYRILITIFIEFFYSPDNLGIQDVVNLEGYLDIFKTNMVRHYCSVLQYLSPVKVPSFAYAWLDFISHRIFMGKCLEVSGMNNCKTWNNYYTLLCSLLTFLKPFMQSVEGGSFSDLYKVGCCFFISTTSLIVLFIQGTIKLFIILLHDFPEFLCEYCYLLCDLIPYKVIQLRNIILSAYSGNLSCPEPCNPSLKMENIYESLQSVQSTSLTLFDSFQLKKELDNYFTNRQPANFANDLGNLITTLSLDNNSKPIYNVSLINTVTFYIGYSAAKFIKVINMTTVVNTAYMDVFQALLTTFDTEGNRPSFD